MEFQTNNIQLTLTLVVQNNIDKILANISDISQKIEHNSFKVKANKSFFTIIEAFLRKKPSPAQRKSLFICFENISTKIIMTLNKFLFLLYAKWLKSRTE